MKIVDQLSRANSRMGVWSLYQANIRIYRRSLLVIFATVLLWLMPLMLVRRSEEQITQLLIVYGEVILPAVLGSMSLGLILNDPYREVLFTTAVQLRHLVISRLSILIGAAALALAAVTGASFLLQQDVTLSIGQIVCGSLVTTIMFTSLGLCFALCFASVTSSGICIAALWTCALLFRDTLLQIPFIQLLHPFMTLTSPGNPSWLINKAILIIMAITATAISLHLLNNNERLTTIETDSEGI